MVAGPALTIPLAPGPPIVGNVRPMITAVGRFLTQQYLRLGPVFRVPILNQRLLVLAGPEANALMKQQGHRLFSSGKVMHQVHEVLGGDHPTLIELDGTDHRIMRAGLKDGYSGRTLYAQMERLVRSQLHMLQTWPRRTPIAAFAHVKRLVSSVLGYMATNQEPAEVMEDLVYFFRALVQIHITRTRPGFMKYLPRYVSSRRSVLAMARRIWDEHHVRDYLERGGDFVDLTGYRVLEEIADQLGVSIGSCRMDERGRLLAHTRHVPSQLCALLTELRRRDLDLALRRVPLLLVSPGLLQKSREPSRLLLDLG